MDVNKIKIFIEAVESGSLLSAAEKLGYTQAGLTHMVKALENELGLVLLQRGKFGVRLTREGSRLMPLFRELVSVQEKIRSEAHLIQEQKASIIRLASVASVIRTCLPDILMAFQKENPAISFEIKEGDDRIYQWFDRGEVDICITSNMIRRDEFQPLFTDEFLAVLPENYPIGRGETYPLSRIEEDPYIGSTCVHDCDVEELLDRYHIHPKQQSTYVDDNSLISMVARGFGISLLPRLVLKNCHEKVLLAPLDRPCSRNIGILCGEEGSSSLSVKKFVLFLKNWNFEQYQR
ncbi:MAG: LysR family transcriptional regulator [Anaerovoracaceae bacterium]